MDAWTGAAALLVAFVLLLVPGMALLGALRPQAGTVRNLALAPAVSIGAVWTVATALTVLRLPVDPRLVGLLALLAPLLLLVVVRRRRVREPAASALAIDRLDVALLAVAVVLVLTEWWIATRGFSAVPPRDDGTHHGFYVARILATSSVDPSQVLVGDVLDGTKLWSFYPLGLHTVAAVVASLGAPVGVAINVVWVAVVALALPLGMFALARRTFPAAPRAAALVALVAALLPAMPTAQLSWGGLAVVAGLALTPAVVDEVLGLLDAQHRSRRDEVLAGLALGLAVLGMFATHSSELATAVVVVLCLLLGDARLRPLLRRWRAALASGLVAAAVLVAVTLPWLGDLRGGAGERYLVAPTRAAHPDWVVYALFFYSAGSLVLAFLVGVGVVASWRRGAAGWVWLTAAVTALTAVVGLALPGAGVLGAPWYANLNRTALTLAFPTAAFLGFALWWCADRSRTALAGRTGARRAVLPGVLLVAVTTGWMLAEATADAKHSFTQIDENGDGRSLLTADARTSWTWLAEHTAPGERVLNEFTDGSGWMYAENGLAPVFPQKLESWQFTGDAAYLLTHAAEVSTDPKARAAAEALDVRYAYLGPAHFPGIEPRLTEKALVDGGWTVVERTPTTVVLQVPSAST